MREKSIMSRRFISQNEVFADIFNYHLYQGKQVIKEDDCSSSLSDTGDRESVTTSLCDAGTEVSL